MFILQIEKQMNVKPKRVGYRLICNVAGKHIEQDYLTIQAVLGEILLLQESGETFIGQITILPINKYEEIIKQR